MRKRLVSASATALLLTVLLLSCLPQKIVDSKRGVIVNPYNFSALDIEGAELALASAEADSELLANLPELNANPYGFSGSDIDWANAQLQQANQIKADLQQMLSTRNYRRLNRFIPNQNQIDSGKIYWSSEKQDVETLALPYWDVQLRLAILEDDSIWTELCNDMISALNVKVEMIDALLHGLHADDSLINEISSEKAEHVVNRKIAVESLVAKYYDELIVVLHRAIELEVTDWSGLEKMITDSVLIEEGRIFWWTMIDSTTNALIPFWEGEAEASWAVHDTLWAGFTEHMLANLSDYLTLANEVLQDLMLDSIVVEGASSESGKDIRARKCVLNELRLSYYRDLIDVLHEGINLGLVEPSTR